MPSSTPSCPICGKPLAAGAPHGLCPACLLKAGVPTGTAAPPGARTRFIPPAPAELARDFPQLEIIELIGQGGMGAVYRARQPSLDRIVALKILPPQTAGDPGFAERFTREARALARLSHANIVAVHDFGQAGAFPYLVMEFVDGVNLRHLLTSGKIAPGEALAIVPPICDALQYAHDRGIVHRDIKPENILLGKNGSVKIADFGLAKLMGADATANFSLTGAGDVMGTPYYMAPEQVERPLEVDHRADIYSLGVVFYQMLTGELPLGRFAPPSRKVTIDVRLDEVVLRALEKSPEQRYQQANALKTEVETIGASTSGPVRVGVGPANSRTSPKISASKGIDYRSQLAWRGLPLLHIATGKDPATGKRRIARGIVAIGTFARGWAAVGLFAFGGIAIGPFAIGVLAFGGCAVGLVALGWSAVGLILATGSTAIGALAYGRDAWAFQAIATTVGDEGIRDFAGKWIQPLARASIIVSVVAMGVLKIASLFLAIRTHGEKSVTRRWVVRLILSGLLPVLFIADFSLFATWSRVRWAGRATIGFVEDLSPEIRNNSAVRDHIILQAWLADLPSTTELNAENFPAARNGTIDGVKVQRFIYRFSVPSGGKFKTSAGMTTGDQFRLELRPFLARQVYRYTATATFDSPTLAGNDRRNEVRSQPNHRTEIAVSEFAVPDRPVFLNLGASTPGRKNVAVILFQPWRAAAAIDPEITRPGTRVVSVPTSAPTVYSLTEFDALESDPQILHERLRLAEANLQIARAKFDAGLNRTNEVLAAEQKVTRLKAKLAGDRLGFAQGDVAVAKKNFAEITARRSAGLATDEDFLTAESELRIAEIRLSQEEARAAQSTSVAPAPLPNR
jgi:Protein kinase domain